LEEGLRSALLRDGRTLLEAMLNDPGLAISGDSPRRGEKTHRQRACTVQSLFGTITLHRRYYYDGRKHAGCCGRVPLDQALGLIESCTPALAKIAARAASQAPFDEASSDLDALAGVQISGRQIQRLVQVLGPMMRESLKRQPPVAPKSPLPTLYVLADGTGVPMNKVSLLNVSGRAADGSARTREVKLGCVFMQSTVDEEGRPVREESSTTYVASFEESTAFGSSLQREARRRGIHKAQRTVVLGDGAAWIWEMARVNFPQAIQILDFWHASEHLADLTRLLHPGAIQNSNALLERWKSLLEDSDLEPILKEARAGLLPLDPLSPTAQAIEREIHYLEKNRQRMDYARFRSLHLFVGSGVIEAGCKSLVAHRLKKSGMFWSPHGAHNVLEIRCALKSQDRFNDFWRSRAAA
jgi:hypothetical protein